MEQTENNIDHRPIEKKLKNGWILRLFFGELIDNDFEQNTDHWLIDGVSQNEIANWVNNTLDKMEQVIEAFGVPQIGSRFSDDNEHYTIHNVWYDCMGEKCIEIYLAN